MTSEQEESQRSLLELAVRHLDLLVNAKVAPPLPPEFTGLEEMRSLHNQVLGLREYMDMLTKGDISQEIPLRGYLAGLLKAHIANLRHLTWQVEQVSQGDFSQQIDFLGDFSRAFNNMTLQLDSTVTNLRATQESLTQLTKTLRQEVELRSAAVAALKQSKARFKYLADHDALTGALNRRSFLFLAEAGVRQAQQHGSPCCIGMLDVDHFKNFNDTYGHLAGDAALKHVVSIGTVNLRQKDSMGRYGGEEFIFFFADSDVEIGRRVAERILDALRTTPVPLESEKVPLTASMGISVILPEWTGERDGAFVQKSIAMADSALYRAKEGGRNRVCPAPVVHPALFDPEKDWDEARAEAPGARKSPVKRKPPKGAKGEGKGAA